MLLASRVRLFLVAFVATFVVVRAWLWATPNADLNVGGYNIHHLYTGVLLLLGSMVPLALGMAPGAPAPLMTAVAGIGLSLVVDEWVYLIATDGTNASYLLPVSFWGGVAMHTLVVASVVILQRRQ
jgi:hypothetical protein